MRWENGKVKLPHLIHRDPAWEIRGIHAYYECRCGARRVRRFYRNRSGPTEQGWPQLTDRHGQPRDDSGWQRP